MLHLTTFRPVASSSRAQISLTIALAAITSLCPLASATVNIQLLPVGDAGNAGDPLPSIDFPPRTGIGAVSYNYSIAKYETTASQYAEFLNAVAKTDTFQLYSSFQGGIQGSGITRTGASGNYLYSVNAAYLNRPVTHITFWSACRFVNWLQNGQPTGLQTAATTEDGAYTLTPAGIANNTITRNAAASWVIPSEDEWYKAAYYKGGGANAGYWLYPAQSDLRSGSDLADLSGNNANYNSSPSSPFPIQSPFYTTVVGQFHNSDSPYGTFDQGGNVAEWTDTILNAGIGGGARGVRGWSFIDQTSPSADASSLGAPTNQYNFSGFRVASILPVPEPATLSCLAFAATALLCRRHGHSALVKR